jgi:hypothetical protein
MQDAPFIGNGSLCYLPNAQLSQNVMSDLLLFRIHVTKKMGLGQLPKIILDIHQQVILIIHRVYKSIN